MLRRIYAVMRARLREFYRDRAGLMWNFVMPLMLLVGFAFIFTGEPEDQFTIGVLGDSRNLSAEASAFLNTKYLKFVPMADEDAAVTKVQRHQLDMLVDLAGGPRYWINEYSAKGPLAEKLLIQAFSTRTTEFDKETVAGKDIRYVDWLIPGVLAMNMMFSCLWGVGWVVVRYRKNGVLRRLQATPLTAFEFLSAQVLTRLMIITLVTTIVYTGAHLLVDFTMRGSYLALFLVFFTGGACLTSMGLIIAARLKTEEVADGLLNLISWPMMILSGVWFSMEGTHPVAQAISNLLPLTHLVNAARRIMIDGAGIGGVVFELTLLGGLTFALLLIAARLFRWS